MPKGSHRFLALGARGEYSLAKGALFEVPLVAERVAFSLRRTTRVCLPIKPPSADPEASFDGLKLLVTGNVLLVPHSVPRKYHVLKIQ